jgi:hypothetical protein
MLKFETKSDLERLKNDDIQESGRSSTRTLARALANR